MSCSWATNWLRAYMFDLIIWGLPDGMLSWGTSGLPWLMLTLQHWEPMLQFLQPKQRPLETWTAFAKLWPETPFMGGSICAGSLGKGHISESRESDTSRLSATAFTCVCWFHTWPPFRQSNNSSLWEPACEVPGVDTLETNSSGGSCGRLSFLPSKADDRVLWPTTWKSCRWGSFPPPQQRDFRWPCSWRRSLEFTFISRSELQRIAVEAFTPLNAVREPSDGPMCSTIVSVFITIHQCAHFPVNSDSMWHSLSLSFVGQSPSVPCKRW